MRSTISLNIRVAFLHYEHTKKPNATALGFFERLLPSEVKCASRVRSAFGTMIGTHHITATAGSNITMRSITSLWRSQNFTKILKPLKSRAFCVFRGKKQPLSPLHLFSDLLDLNLRLLFLNYLRFYAIIYLKGGRCNEKF